MKLHYPRDPSEVLYRRTLRAAGVMVAGAGLMWLASSMTQAGHDIAKQPYLPEARSGIGKNIEIIAPNLGRNVLKQTAESTLTDVGWFGIGAGILLGLSGAADMMVIAHKLDPNKREVQTTVNAGDHHVPTSRIVGPETTYDPEAPTAIIPKVVINDDLHGLPDFTTTQVLARVV